ncbi:hypothetical protein [Janthinobacterium sp. SUN120]|uniref:hypothetical protein n=1 Tax=Janthinobacterium sp. SUN120 TaxID=3004099 RepID=UPI0025B26417|nr:hypothetical protein [Janthinobacterium sp. SUN120]MDN2716958.1 hypothetical protein [Janthinobacterium sp. SUN120]
MPTIQLQGLSQLMARLDDAGKRASELEYILADKKGSRSEKYKADSGFRTGLFLFRRRFSSFSDTGPGIASCKKFISANSTIALLWGAAWTTP